MDQFPRTVNVQIRALSEDTDILDAVLGQAGEDSETLLVAVVADVEFIVLLGAALELGLTADVLGALGVLLSLDIHVVANMGLGVEVAGSGSGNGGEGQGGSGDGELHFDGGRVVV